MAVRPGDRVVTVGGGRTNPTAPIGHNPAAAKKKKDYEKERKAKLTAKIDILGTVLPPDTYRTKVPIPTSSFARIG